MISTRARSSALMTLAAASLLAARTEAQRMGEPEATARATEGNGRQSQPASRWSLCGAGRYDLVAAGQTVGNETFEISCKADGQYTATGHTQLTAGAATLDLTTNLAIGADMLPISASAKGTVQGQPFEQTGTFANGTATLVSNGMKQTVTYPPGASWMGGNIFYPNVFILARYDEAKGGVQEFTIFPQVTATVERRATDGVKLDNGESGAFTRFVLRVAAQEIVFWRDAAGKLAIIAIPPQRFSAARPESAKWVPALLANLSAAPGGGAPAGGADAKIDYSAPPGAPFTAEEVTIPVATYKLAGTLLVPKAGKAPFPAVVMVTGSGLQTRDSRLPLPGLEQYAPFRQIAERLASHGVAVLRADDRGIGGSTGRETLENATTTSLAEDTRAQVAWLRGRKEVDPARVIIIGHSEGATIAAMLGATDPKIAGVVMMAGMGKSGAEVSIEQQEDLLRSDTTMSEATKASMREKQREAVKTVLAGGDIPGQKTNAWIREYFAYAPLPTIRKVKQPLLILQGELDRQVLAEHAEILAKAAREAGNTHVTMKVFPSLNHLFLPAKTGSFSEYSHLATPRVPDVVLDTIVEWVASVTQR